MAIGGGRAWGRWSSRSVFRAEASKAGGSVHALLARRDRRGDLGPGSGRRTRHVSFRCANSLVAIIRAGMFAGASALDTGAQLVAHGADDALTEPARFRRVQVDLPSAVILDGQQRAAFIGLAQREAWIEPLLPDRRI